MNCSNCSTETLGGLICAGSASGIHTPPLAWLPFKNLIFAIAK